MPNGEEFEKKLSEWEKQSQLYREQARTSQQQVAVQGKELEHLATQQGSWYEKWFGGGAFGSAFWKPRTWFAPITGPSMAELIEQRNILRTDIQQATADLERSDFFARLYGEAPLAISAGAVSSPDELLTMLTPPAELTADELADVRSTVSDMIASITEPSVLPELEEIEYPPLVAPAPVTRVPVTLHHLSTQEIIKSLKTPRTPESAMTKREWEEFLKLKGYDDEDIDNEQQLLAEELIASWQDRNSQLEAFRTGIAEMPEYKLTDMLKEMAFQPGLALAEVAMVYFEHVSMPLAGKLYKNFIPDLEAEYQRFKVANPDVSDREALVHAWVAWDAPFEGWQQWVLKYMLMEGLVDPLTYVGWGIAAKLTKPIPYVGRMVGAAERGAMAVFELPFDAAKWLVRKFPKTLTQRATMAQHQASQYVERYLTKATGRHLSGMSMKDFTEASERAIKYALNNPQLEDDIALAGREMLKHAPVDERLVIDWSARLGTTLRAEDITRVTVENIENLFEDLFTKKLITKREAAGQLLKIFNVGDMSDDALKLAQRMLESRAASIQRGAIAFTKAKTPLAAMRALASKNFRTHIVTEESAAALARKETGAFSTLLHNTDLKLQGIWRNGIDRWVVRPFAESYLTFGMYGPMNVLEDYIRSTLGGVIPRRMNIEAWEKLTIGLKVDPELKRYGISEMIGPLAREGPEQNWNNWILQAFALGQKGWADKIYKTMVRLPGAYGMDVRRNFISKRYLQLLADAGGDEFRALAKAGPRSLPKLADRKLIKDLEATVYSLKTTGNPDAVRGAKDIFTRRRIVRNDVSNILKEHPELPNTARDYIARAFDDDVVFREGAESIERTVAETRNILLDDFIRGPEIATQQYHQLADFLTTLEVRNPQEMASAIQAVYKMSEIYGALPDQIIAQATIRSRGLPLAERRATFDADFDRIYQFLDAAGADIDRVIAKIKLDVPKLAETNYQDAATRLFDTMTAKREYTTEFRAQNMATRSEIFAGVSKKEMTADFWDNFYLQMNNEYRTLNLRMAELDGQLVRAIEEMNIAAGAKITPRAPLVVKDRPLAPQDIATLLGVRGDDISRALLDVLTIQNNKDFFVAYVQGMIRPGDAGFTKEAIGAVYDQIAYSLRVSPESMSWITGRQMELDAVRKELHSLYNSKMLPDEEIAAIGRYLDDTADAVDNLMYKEPEALDITTGYRSGTTLRESTGESATEGVGLYVAKDRSLAKWFAKIELMPGEKVRVTKVRYREPKKPFILQDTDELMILQEVDKIMNPIKRTDSPWVKYNKQAAKEVGVTDATWSQKLPTLNKRLSELISADGYDAIRVPRSVGGGESWDVLIDPSLWKGLPPAPAPIRMEVKLAKGEQLFYHQTNAAVGIKKTGFVVGEGAGVIKAGRLELPGVYLKSEPGLVRPDIIGMEQLAVKVKLTNPVTFDSPEAFAAWKKSVGVKVARRPAMYDLVEPGTDFARALEREHSQTLAALRERGYDAVIIAKDPVPDMPGEFIRTTIVLDPTNVTPVAPMVGFEDQMAKIVSLEKELDNVARESAKRAKQEYVPHRYYGKWGIEEEEKVMARMMKEFEALRKVKPDMPIIGREGRVFKPEFKDYDTMRQTAMDEAHKWYYKEYPDYTNANAFDALMKTIYPYWTYESQRWFWLPRSFVRHPGTFTGFERWQNNSDYGYIHIPGTSVDINPFRGTIYGTLTTRLTRRDFPEYYDSLGATKGLVEFNDYLSRFGFYPGAHINIPLAAMGGLEQQMGETIPAIWKTPLNALIAAFPESESVKWLSDHIFSDRFREYMTILEVNKRGYNGSHLWTKIKEEIDLTEEEQAIWDSARGEAALYGVGFEQFGLFRLRSDEQYKAYEESSKAIEEITGYTPEQQDWLRRHGYRIWDMVGGLSPTNQAMLQELESYKWLGTVTPLLPSRQQLELRKLDLDWDDVMQFAESGRDKRLQLQQQFLSGEVGPRDYTERLQTSYTEQRSYIDKKMEENPNMTLEGRKEYYKKYGIPIPVQHPMRELLNLYFSIELNTEAIDPETGEIYTDWDSFFAQRAAIEDAILPELKEEWEAYLSRNTTRMEEIRRDVSNTYFRKYYDVWEATLALYPENEQKLINEFLYLERTGQQLERQDEIKEIISAKTGNQLISSFRSEVSDNRAALRYTNPSLDAWLFFWGRVTSFKTPQAEAIYQQISRDTGRVKI